MSATYATLPALQQDLCRRAFCTAAALSDFVRLGWLLYCDRLIASAQAPVGLTADEPILVISSIPLPDQRRRPKMREASLSRRHFLKMSGVAAAGLALAACAAPVAAPSGEGS